MDSLRVSAAGHSSRQHGRMIQTQYSKNEDEVRLRVLGVITMIRSRFVGAIVACDVLVVMLVVAGAREPAPPNLVFIFCDNLGYGDTQPFGSRLNKTPNLVRMAREGRKVHGLLRCRRRMHAVAREFPDGMLSAPRQHARERSHEFTSAGR